MSVAESESLYDVVVIGSGPAGYTAGIYAARANFKTLIIAGVTPGGQLMLTGLVENFPGFPEGVQGPELMDNMRGQAENAGVEIIYDDAVEVDFNTYPRKVMTSDRVFQAKAVIIATGASPKWLGLEAEKRLLGRGVSSCATCDGPLFRGAKCAVVVGGGDSAMEYALFLANLVEKVVVVHRRDKLRASKIMQERALSNPKIEFAWNSLVVDVLGRERVEGVKIRNKLTGEERVIPCEALFVAIGHAPSTEIFRGKIDLDDEGYVKLHNGLETNVRGVFAAGDVHDKRYRQAITAAGFGCMAAMEAIRFIEEGWPEKLMEEQKARLKEQVSPPDRSSGRS
ncbi:MAG: thioredoxin-disulfide reductase [Nitrososphaerota archaeon]|nr:thioredoxin-disulfide reductase [Candidatus Calditenuaceae archaeon]MDW8073548.1 thioredoxin-disulfide reductase [Nitrososphaerota archaeon]